jgi:hypothetical protein
MNAQDSHYWNLQYGTKSTLLGGAVIGSVNDLSATYYNPGAVALFEDPKLILSAEVYQYEKITVVDGAGENKDLDYSSISPSPSFLAFKINIDSTGRNKLAISVLTRQAMNFEFETRQVENDFEDITDNVAEAAGLYFLQKFDEIWAGATFSRKMSENVGLGISAYVAYRNQTTNLQTVIETLDTANQISSSLLLRKLKFDNYRALLKAGLGVRLDPITFGLTITTPSVNILGTGSYSYHNFLNNPDDVSKNIYQSNYQEDLATDYNTSWAVGVGSTYWGEVFSVHVSAEWYNAVKNYEPMVLAPLNSQGTGETFSKQITQQFKSIINAGIGLDYKLNDKVSLAGSFITDFSANDRSYQSSLSLSEWDIYHVSAGSYFKIGNSEITLGVSYSFGNDYIKPIPDLNNPNNGTSSTVGTSPKVKFSRIKVLFGFIF